MKTFYLVVLPLAIFNLSRADMIMPPGAQDLRKKEWEQAKCKDPKNLIVCEFAVPEPNSDDCLKYRGKPTQYKQIATQGSASYGSEKYCKLQGLDGAK